MTGYYAFEDGRNRSLSHFGIKGQQWGVRRFQNLDGTLTPEGKQRYSDAQRAEDKRLYGNLAARRIAKKVESGSMGVKAARHDEVMRIDRFRNAAKTAGTVGAVTGSLAGHIFADDILRRTGVYKYTTNDPIVKGLARSGVAMAGGSLAGTFASSVVMLSGGYSPRKLPNKYRKDIVEVF